MNKHEGQVSIAALMPHAPVLVPALGGERGGLAASSIRSMGLAAARVVGTRPDSVVLVSPHTPRRPAAFAIWRGGRLTGSLARFGAPHVRVDLPNDLAFAERITAEAALRGVEMWWLHDEEMDHGATVPLWHLVNAGWSGPTVLIGLNYPGEPGLLELGEAIAGAARRMNRRIAVIASGDMSHRLEPGAPSGFHPRAKEFDRCFIEGLESGQYQRLARLDPELQDLAAEDAVDSTLVAASAVNWDSSGHKVLSYEGPFGVGYGVAILHESDSNSGPAAIDRVAAQTLGSLVHGDELPRVARQSVEAALYGDAGMPDFRPDGLLAERMGVFVTIRGPGGKLRGCVGTLSPQWSNVVEETWHVARDAAFRDVRFKRVSAGELADLRFDVSLISPAEEIDSTDKLDPRRFGVVVTAADGRRGALLPNIEGVETVEQQLEVACEKGGIHPSEPMRLHRFAAMKFRE